MARRLGRRSRSGGREAAAGPASAARPGGPAAGGQDVGCKFLEEPVEVEPGERVPADRQDSPDQPRMLHCSGPARAQRSRGNVYEDEVLTLNVEEEKHTDPVRAGRARRRPRIERILALAGTRLPEPERGAAPGETA